jgi:ClpP class serine protease
MGVYSEYLDRQMGFEELAVERKKQLQRIADIRKRDVLVFAADMTNTKAMNTALLSIGYADIMPISDQIQNLSGSALDLILETPGGSGEVAEEIIRILRRKYPDLAVIVPGWAKSAGTLMAMGADDILMGATSALGPIDAQLQWQGKVFSADALLEGVEKIKDEVKSTGNLNKAYIPILQGISPGELQSAENVLKFARALVTSWLPKYKFKAWTKRASSGQPVTDADREARAEEIAKQLCDHRRWLTHGRSIKIDDLAAMKVEITDYDKIPDLADAIRRYYTLLEMTFAAQVYKVFETPKSQVYRMIAPTVSKQPAGPAMLGPPDSASIEAVCGKCSRKFHVQANLKPGQPLEANHLPFPPGNVLPCPNCQAPVNLTPARQQLEALSKKRIVP